MTKEYVKDFHALAEFMLNIANAGKSVAAVLETEEAEKLFTALQEYADIEYGLIDLIGSACDPTYREYYVILTPDETDCFIDICPVHVDHDNREPINNACVDVLVFHYDANTEILDANEITESHVVMMGSDERCGCNDGGVVGHDHTDPYHETRSESVTISPYSIDFDAFEQAMFDSFKYMLNRFQDYLNE